MDNKGTGEDGGTERRQDGTGEQAESPKVVTLSGRPAAIPHGEGGAPQPVDPVTGMMKDYWVLSPAERAKGFVRPVRRSYRHIGIRPQHVTRGLTEEELQRFAGEGYIEFESYPQPSSVTGRFWTRAQLESGCGGVTTMHLALSETYARDPGFYGSTFCSHCGAHFPVGRMGEFVWEGTNDRVGT